MHPRFARQISNGGLSLILDMHVSLILDIHVSLILDMHVSLGAGKGNLYTGLATKVAWQKTRLAPLLSLLGHGR